MNTTDNCNQTNQPSKVRKSPTGNALGPPPAADLPLNPIAQRNSPIRMLRLAQVKNMTGLGKTKIYELQGEGSFPMRVKITPRSVGWVEDDVQAWLARRIQANVPLETI